MADLFELTDLAASLQADLDTASAAEARRKAQAWLMSATHLTEWPTPTDEVLRAWALELAAFAYDNPSGLESETVDNTSSNWGAAVARRAEILALARTVYGTAGAQWAFPGYMGWPDPAERCWPVYTGTVL